MAEVPDTPSTLWHIESAQKAESPYASLAWDEDAKRYEYTPKDGSAPSFAPSHRASWLAIDAALRDLDLDNTQVVPGWEGHKEAMEWTREGWLVYSPDGGTTWAVKRSVDQERATKTNFVRADAARDFVERRIDRTIGPLRGAGWRGSSPSDKKVEAKVTAQEKAVMKALCKQAGMTMSEMIRALFQQDAASKGVQWPEDGA